MIRNNLKERINEILGEKWGVTSGGTEIRMIETTDINRKNCKLFTKVIYEHNIDEIYNIQTAWFSDPVVVYSHEKISSSEIIKKLDTVCNGGYLILTQHSTIIDNPYYFRAEGFNFNDNMDWHCYNRYYTVYDSTGNNDWEYKKTAELEVMKQFSNLTNINYHPDRSWTGDDLALSDEEMSLIKALRAIRMRKIFENEVKSNEYIKIINS